MTHITTVEGVGTSKKPHPVQSRLVTCHAVQCGYDTPGLVMAIYSALVSKDQVTAEEIIKQCDGVLSRCNGYMAVIDGVKSFAGNNTEEKMKLEEKMPEELKMKDEFPLVFKGRSNVWTIVENKADAKSVIDGNSQIVYGSQEIEMGNQSVVSIYPDGDANVTDDGITIETNLIYYYVTAN